MRQKVSDEQLREIVVARITKGSAFMLKHGEYEKNMKLRREYLASLTRDEIFQQYPEYVYDIAR